MTILQFFTVFNLLKATRLTHELTSKFTVRTTLPRVYKELLVTAWNYTCRDLDFLPKVTLVETPLGRDPLFYSIKRPLNLRILGGLLREVQLYKKVVFELRDYACCCRVHEPYTPLLKLSTTDKRFWKNLKVYG